MSTLNVKQQARSLIKTMPDNCTWEDIMHQVYVILAVEAGLADSQAGRVKSVDEVRFDVLAVIHGTQNLSST